MLDPILPVAPDSTTADSLPLLTNPTPIPTSGSSSPIILEQTIGAVQTSTNGIIPLNASVQNAVSTTIDLLPPQLDIMLVADDGFSGSDRVTSKPDITGMVSDNIGIDRLLGKFTGQAGFIDITNTLQADGTFTIDRQRLGQIKGNALAAGDYQFEVRAIDLAGNLSTKAVQFSLENPLLYSYKVNDSETTTSSSEVNKFKYTGTWNLAVESNAYGKNAHWTNDLTASYEVKFYGSQAQLFSVRNPWGGIAGISVDGGAETLVDTYGTDWQNQAFFKSSVLETGLHTIKVRVTGQKNAASGDHMISIDRLNVLTPDLNTNTGTTDLATVATANNQSLLFSPYGWGTVNNGVQTSNAGAYIKFRFNGTQAALNVDTSNQTSFPLLDVYVDGKQTGDQLWLKNANNGQIQLFGGSAGDHDVVVYFRRRELFDGTNATVTAAKQQDWLTDAEHLRVNGVQISGGTGFLDNSFARNKTAVFFGDSITEGGVQTYEPNAPDRPANFPFTDIVNNFSYKTYAARLGDLLNVEYGQIGWSGSGWLRPSTPTGNPPVLDSWLRFNGQSAAQRNFDPQPDYVFMNLGTNDIPFNAGENNISFNVTDTAYTWLKEARQRIPGAEIFVIYPFNQTKNAELRQGIIRYLSENPADTKVHALNLGDEGARGLVGQYIAEFAVDSVHPTASRHQQLAGLLYDKIKPIVGLSSTIIEDTSTASATGLNTAKYTGLWQNAPLVSNPALYSYLSSDTDATYEVTFRGDRLRLFGNKDASSGIAAISIDGGAEISTDFYSSNPLNDDLIYQSGTLGNGFHTIKVRVTGQHSASSLGNIIDIGKLEIF